MLQGKTIVLGVTGGIASYKAAALCSKLAQAGADVRVIMTASATKFVAPLTFQTLSRHDVAVDTFDEKDATVVQHIDLADSADLVVIAPATANIIAKMAHGIADDMLSTTILATEAPILVAPAMNVHMYAHPAVVDNMRTLRNRDISFIEPGEGQLACGYVGKGRLAEPEEIMAAIGRMLNPTKPLAGKRVLVTAGGTMERIDPVRYITNDSSGKMGYAIAEAAKRMGADVTLVTAKASIAAPTGMKVVRVESTLDMMDAVLARFEQTDIVIKAAAVADYRPAYPSDIKIKKKDDTMTLELVKNPDIAQTLGERKTTQFIVSFAAETNNGEQYALDKLKRKKSDLLVLNDVTVPGAGFGTDTNIVQIFDGTGLVAALPQMSKRDVAERLLSLVAERLDGRAGSDA
ncbi:bifunctional phosphopantothenoylcysteine decarboxylase/phosphopantothenate--cysteine ligase CoaBC [Paenibacillus hemerocallicola]|uniref:Coenzyme A biosynthesis bifunctional protein CoaBC n=1 Tax=Paenibacillus hemerocallicola TaxID=1172614 RepID=A0A5C4TDV4_9BACL|nr:bifunctional phosphopantothenoylcysteine decarboxylase/phosphopantothenate--cysteine ligase CoaBC [Paenibacillus hemerocallicola]TNJ67211.1 bifunctional phosphopantothenoylcysteine decarboxylase/phosphopantothenate--cysteine ligase CoaBC [Paenibacillus hemerocallicola]